MAAQFLAVKTILILSALYSGLLFGTSSCYNVEVGKVGIARGKEGWQFGYSVALVRAPGWAHDSTGFLAKELLIGAPNFDYNNIKGHGQISGCSNILEPNITCNWLNITDVTKMCDRLSLKTDTDCAMESRLGATMEVNRKYPDVRDDVNVPMVTVCAPGWKNVYPESDSLRYQNYMIGMCIKMREDLKPVTCTRTTCWPFWPDSATTVKDGRPVFTYAEAGIAATYTLDGRSEIVSAPGADDWRGAYKAVQKGWLKRLDYSQAKTIYFGYAITTGQFGTYSEYIASGSPNWNNPRYGHFGRVELFSETTKQASVEYGIPQSQCEGELYYDLRETIRNTIDENQMGSKFGATLEAVDLNGDGLDELLVGAPLYTGKKTEEGRVFVYTSFEGQAGICGPIGILSGSANVGSLEEKSSFARFGAAIASVGDLDLDGYNDVAIGAPFEDDGTGAVYIYNGFGQCGCKMEDIYSQRIAGNDIDAGLRAFGWSIYGNEDIDDNSFPDLAVGAYEANSVIMLRTKPIVNIDVEISMSPNPIPLNGSLIKCSTNGVLLCFEVTVLFKFSAVGSMKGNVGDIKLAWTLDSDTVHKEKEGWSRVVFRENGGQDMLIDNITLSSSSNRMLNKTYTLDVKEYRGKPEPKDAWTKVRMEGRYELIPTNENDFKALDPIIHKDAKREIVEYIEFDKKCDSIDTCTSDLKLTVEMFLIQDGVTPTKVEEDTVIYVDAANILEVTADVLNLLNSSYRASLDGQVTALMKRDALPNYGLVGGSCNEESLHQTSTNISCTADSKLDRNENMKIKMYFDVSRQRLVPNMNIEKMKEFVHISLKADQANKDVNIDNNIFEKKIGVKLKYEVRIEEDNAIYDQIRYTADQTSKRKITIIHRYYIINDGPSFLPKTYVNITIPLSKDDTDVAVIKNMSTNCRVRGTLPQVQTTTPVLTTPETTRHFTQPDTDVERKRREAAQETAMAKSSNEISDESKQGKNITCEEFICATIECAVTNLEKSTNEKEEYIDVTIDIFEKELAKEKDVGEVKYATTATVTDPAIWYGGKVVPWERTIYAEKWTTFVVEPTSVVSEVNIWIIIGSVLGALALLIIVIIILWKCGFFNRKKHSKVQEWKRASLYNRKSVKLSPNDKQPYTAMEEKGPDDS